MISKREDPLLKAVSGLLGGIVCRGSTCGVVSGGAFGLALMHDDALKEDDLEAQVGLLSLVADYVAFFGRTYGTVLCRERTGTDFWALGGLLRYMLPGDRMLRCLSHISGSMKYLYDSQRRSLPGVKLEREDAQSQPIHCARAVMEGVRANTGVGDPLVERLSIVLDGGVGLQGGACGALAGAIMAVNLQVGANLREATLPQAYTAFFGGLKHVRADRPEEGSDPYDVGKTIVRRFAAEAASIECRSITGRSFQDWTSFQAYVSTSNQCQGLIELSIEEATAAIERHMGREE
jgi:hypothetical protein